jgi:haloalkane dehalogenase
MGNRIHIISYNAMNYKKHFVQRNHHRIYVREYAGEDLVIILMHGFPDNLYLYDRLGPCLSPPRHIVAFDFLGWGASEKPSDYSCTAENQMGELNAVIKRLALAKVVLVAHDASGPPAINWALSYPEKIAGLVLLNTYYCMMPTLRPPEAISLFSTPLVRRIARPVSQMFGNLIFRKMFWWQVGKFFRDARDRDEFLPLLYRQFETTPITRPAFFGLNEDVPVTIRSGTGKIQKLREFRRPVRIIFGEADPYLNRGVAKSFNNISDGLAFLLFFTLRTVFSLR